MNPRLFRVVVALVWSAVLVGRVFAAEVGGVVFLPLPLKASVAEAAAKEGKVIVIDFYTTWCEPCKRLDQETWTDAAVGKLVNEKAIALRLDAEKEGKTLADRYKVTAYPTVVVLKPDGTLMDRLVGFREPAVFVRDFNLVLEGKTMVDRAQEAVNAMKRPVAAQAAAQPLPTGDFDFPMETKTVADVAGTTVTPAAPRPAPPAGLEEEVKARYEFGKELARAGRDEEAMAEFVWLFRDGMKGAPRYAGVRVSFLTSDMGRIAKKYSPARDVLRNLRDDAGARLLGDATDRDAASDFAALNDVLDENEMTLRMLPQLPANDPRREVLGQRVLRQLVEARQYGEAAQLRSYAQAVAQLDRTLNAAGRMSASMAQSIKASTARNAAITAEALAGSGDVENAQLLVKKILELSPTSEVKDDVKKRMKRAGHPELAP